MKKLCHKFIEFIPDTLEDDMLYVSLNYATVSHLCRCGCGREVVTPLSPTDWMLIFDGETISLHPSIGNWNFPCRSHYWIRNNRVEWARDWSKSKSGIIWDKRHDDYRLSESPGAEIATEERNSDKPSLWSKLLWWKRIQ